MNKKKILFTLLALTTGALLGYTGRALAQKSNSPEEELTEVRAATPPRFGDSRPSAARKAASSSIKKTGTLEHAELDDMLKRYTRMSPEELWDEWEKLSSRETRFYYFQDTTRDFLLSYIFTRLGQDAPRQTLRQLQDRKELAQYQYAIIESWGEKNPEAAMAYCLENIGKDTRADHALKNKYISLLTKSSPNKAIDYICTLPSQERANHLSYPLSLIAQKTPEKMEEIIKRLYPSGKQTKWTSGQIAAAWAGSDWTGAEKWVKSQPEENRTAIMGRIISSLPREEALKKLEALNEKEKETVLARKSFSLFRESPEKALDWLQANVKEEQVARIIQNNYFRFNYYDAGFLSYLDKMPVGAVKDNMLEKAISQQSSNDPRTHFFDPTWEETLSLVNKISSTEKKDEVLNDTLESWVENDPEKIKSWVEKSQLPDDRKKKLIQRCDDCINENR